MPVRAISRERFNMLAARDPAALLMVQEYDWFANGGDKSIGTVFFDQSDRDWAYAVLERASDGKYRWIEGDCSIDSQAKAIAQLKTALKNREDEHKDANESAD